MTSLCMPRWLGQGWLHLLRLVPTLPKPFSKILTKLGRLGTSFVEVDASSLVLNAFGIGFLAFYLIPFIYLLKKTQFTAQVFLLN